MSTLSLEQTVNEAVVVPATWRAYVELLEARGEKSTPRYTFVDGRLTIVSPGPIHETLKCRLIGMIGEVLVALQIPFCPTGSVTLWAGRRAGPKRRKGAEADGSFYLWDLSRIVGKTTLRMGVDSPPDLAIEVAETHEAEDNLRVFHKYREPEVWVCRGGAVEFLVWAAGRRRWDRIEVSRALPGLSAAEVTTWLYDPERDESAFRARFRAWIAATVVPRQTP
jgi:Uma2 family endonuclease